MNITIISGSPRTGSQSLRTAHYLQSQIEKSGQATNIVDLSNIVLPLYDDTFNENENQKSLWNPTFEILSKSDAFVFITPEWNGMASPSLKNFFMYCDRELAHKPALLVAVTSSFTNGAYPIAELRASSYKNNAVCYIPNHVIVRSVEQCFADEVPNLENKADTSVRERIGNSLSVLFAYAKALKIMREDTFVEWEKFPYGM